MNKSISNLSEVIACHHNFPLNQNSNIYYLHPQQQNSHSLKHHHFVVTESKSKTDLHSQNKEAPVLSYQQSNSNPTPHSDVKSKSRETNQTQKQYNTHKRTICKYDQHENPEIQIPNEPQVLKALLKRERKEKEYWKNYSLKLQEQSKALKEVIQKLRNSQKEFENAAIKSSQQLISQQIVNEKLVLQKQMMKLLNQKKELTHQTKQLKKQLSKSKSQSCPPINSNEFSFGSRVQESHRWQSDKESIYRLKKLVRDQQMNINETNQQLMGVKIKLLSYKYQKY